MKKESTPVHTQSVRKPMLELLTNGTWARSPIWLMRQAGRYLPEYRAVRAQTRDFLDLCYSPDKAVEVTLQPLRRYDLDAAILFADILLVPHALGQGLRFAEGEGPRLDKITQAADLAKLSVEGLMDRLEPVIETVRRLSVALPPHITLIGFAGAPWTVATYMVAGQGTDDQAPARLMAYAQPDLFQKLIDLLVEATASYLLAQVAAGAEVIQIFDTWAGSLPEKEFTRWVIEPTKRLVALLKAKAPDVPIIGFPRGAGTRALDYAQATGIQGLSFDAQAQLPTMAQVSDHGIAVQGNIDPLVLVSGGIALDQAVDDLMAAMRGRRHIVNLGHGIVPQTPPDHVAQLIARVRAFQA